MDDMTQSIEPKSDQMNAEDLLSGPRTFTITRVRVTETPDQPVHVYLDGFPADRPFKPGKTVRRLMVVAWGSDSSAYVGKRMTLYRDPQVKWGGMDVGGIRVSHMSGLNEPLNVALTVTRGRRAPYTVDPLPDAAAGPSGVPPRPSLADRAGRMVGGFAALGVTEADLARRIGRPRAGWAEDDLTGMTDVYAAMRRGDLTRDAAFPRTDVTVDDLPPDPDAAPRAVTPSEELAQAMDALKLTADERDQFTAGVLSEPLTLADLPAEQTPALLAVADNLRGIGDPEQRNDTLAGILSEGAGLLLQADAR